MSHRASRPAASLPWRSRPLGLLLGLVLLTAHTQLKAQDLVELSYQDKSFQGLPLFVSPSQSLLLARDGRLRRLPGTELARIDQLQEKFQSYSHEELQNRLYREFGQALQITRTRHYVVVHPPGQQDVWAQRFEQLYANFVHYFARRQLVPIEPEFPLVALVFHDRAEFAAYARKMKEPVPANVIGYYSPRTNRIALYDTSRGGADSESWAEDAATIYHEAAHQAAFNTGLHHRFTGPPRWLSEGLGTMFESPGVWNSAQFSQRSSRINQRMLAVLGQSIDSPNARLSLDELIESDRHFETNPQLAYATAWGLTFYLAETRPADYVAYLQQTAAKPPFEHVTAEQRLEDWQRHFKQSPDALERHLWDFLSQLDPATAQPAQ